ncbi:MAG: hypothetical protein RR240_03140, partial [Burkholderiaceae bacterium]
VAFEIGGVAYLQSGDFTISSLVYRTPDTANVQETASAQLSINRRNDKSFVAIGSFNVLRHGRTDAYSNVSVVSTAPDASGSMDLASGTMDIASPRFGAQALHVVGDQFGGMGVTTVTAPDGSLVKVTDMPGAKDAARFDVQANTKAAPSVTQTHSWEDSAMLAALKRALQ